MLFIYFVINAVYIPECYVQKGLPPFSSLMSTSIYLFLYAGNELDATKGTKGMFTI